MFFFLLLYHDVNYRNKDIMMIVMIDCNIFENTKRHRKINNFLLLTRLALGFFFLFRFREGCSIFKLHFASSFLHVIGEKSFFRA